MPRLTNAELERRLAELEAENAELRSAAADAADTLPLYPETAPTVEGAREKRSRSRGWALLSTVLILIGVVLAPVAIVSTWARAQLTDTERFVATFAPLARDPEVRAFVTDQAVTVINDSIDIPRLTSDVVDGITALGTPERATAALEALKGPAAAGIQSLIQSRIAAFVESDAFADVWASALRITHRQLIATMAGDDNAAVTLGPNGQIGVQLAPIIDAAKKALVDQGIGFASRIPTIDRTITVAQSDSIPTVQLYYGLAVAAGAWLPWVTLLFLVAGVLAARRKSVAMIATAVVLALVMIILLIGFAVGHAIFVTSVAPGTMPSGVSGVLFGTVVAGMHSTTVAVLVLAIVVAVVGWFAGPFDVPRKLRGLAASGASTLRGVAEKRGLTTGRVGQWMHRQRALLRSAVAVVAALIIVLVRPLTPALTLWTLVISLVVIAIIEVVQRPPAPEEIDDESDPMLAQPDSDELVSI